METLKNTPEALAALGILNAIGMSPGDIQTAMVEMFGAKTTTVMTNVPGPPMTLYLGGSKIEDLMFWVPQSGRVSLGISIISYTGSVMLGVASDVGLIPDPETIIEGFNQEYGMLMGLAHRTEPNQDPDASPVDDDRDRCLASTKSGRRCRNRSRDGSRFCYVHQAISDPA
jgi:hypothetical protein